MWISGCLAVSTLTKISDGSEFQPVMVLRGGILESICSSIYLVEMFSFSIFLVYCTGLLKFFFVMLARLLQVLSTKINIILAPNFIL